MTTTPQEPLYAHPETGEVLESLEDFRAALREAEARLGPVYRLRDKLTAAMAERFEPAALPQHRRHRTKVQEAITHCPRCGASLDEPPPVARQPEGVVASRTRTKEESA